MTKPQKTIQTGTDINPNDIFSVNPYEYFIVEGIRKINGELYFRGVQRDGIYTVGCENPAEYTETEILEGLDNDEFEYCGVFAYQGATDDEPKGIDGEPVEVPNTQ